jgi:hypothetical protein
MLQEALNELRKEWPEGYRLIRKRVFRDRSVAEIAFRCWVSEGAVRSELESILNWLSQRLQPGHTTRVTFPVQGVAA